MKILNSNEKKIVSSTNITFIKYKLVSQVIDKKTLYGIILSQRINDGDDQVLSAPDFTDEYDKALTLFNSLVEGVVTAESFYDIFDDFFVC